MGVAAGGREAQAWRGIAVFLLFVKDLMHEGDRYGSLSDRRCHPLDIAGPYVTDGEDAWQACFEKMRGPAERPLRGGEIVVRQVRPGLDEPLLAERQAAIEPACIGHGARHEADVPD